jgi:methylated-DNA-[protein]-cysteine S-methyltransferase
VIYYTHILSPIDPLLLTSDGESLTGLYMTDDRYSPATGNDEKWRIPEIPQGWVREDDAQPFGRAREQLAAYFAGALTEFDLPLAMEGTSFQTLVWEALKEIPFGTTVSYGELARRVGNPKGSRAVGLANGQNPISIVVPCHRVIGSNGKLTGYGGGLPRKAALLDFEFTVALNGPGPFPPVVWP